MREAKRQKRLKSMSQNNSLLKSNFSDDESEISSDESERAMSIQRDIKKLTGMNLNVKAVEVDFTQMRKIVHTPPYGIEPPESIDFFKEQIANNQYLKDFMEKYDTRLNKDIEVHLKKMHSGSLKSHLVVASPMRQASERNKKTRKFSVKNPDIMPLKPIQEDDHASQDEDYDQNQDVICEEIR